MGIPSFVVPDWVKKAGVAIGALVLLAGILGLAYCKGESAGKKVEQAKQLEAQIEDLANVLEANETAAGERVDDAKALSQQERELNDARTTPGESRNTRNLRALCVQLRAEGTDTTKHPTCCRFEGGSGTCDPS